MRSWNEADVGRRIQQQRIAGGWTDDVYPANIVSRILPGATLSVLPGDCDALYSASVDVVPTGVGKNRFDLQWSRWRFLVGEDVQRSRIRCGRCVIDVGDRGGLAGGQRFKVALTVGIRHDHTHLRANIGIASNIR